MESAAHGCLAAGAPTSAHGAAGLVLLPAGASLLRLLSTRCCQDNAIFADQFETPANFRAHLRTGQEIWEQVGGACCCRHAPASAVVGHVVDDCRWMA